jgi:hypothetical protein
MKNIRNEIEVMKMVNHPQCISLCSVYESANHAICRNRNGTGARRRTARSDYQHPAHVGGAGTKQAPSDVPA